MATIETTSARAQLEALIEQAIETLDRLDGDADQEPEEGGACEVEDMRPSMSFKVGALEDDEPSLGSLTCVGSCSPEANGQIGFSQIAWSAGNGLDLEEEHDGSEPDVDDEPSLGWTLSGALGEITGYDGELKDYAG